MKARTTGAPIAAAIALATTVVALSLAPPAQAATSVSGAGDSGPLTIAPDSDPTVYAISTYVGKRVAYVYSMPADKQMTAVTIGDLGRGDSCDQDASVRLYAREYPDGDWKKTWDRVIRSDSPQPLTTNAGKVTFQFQPWALVQGRAYEFLLEYASGCGEAKLTTWSHNEGQVDGGSIRCNQVIQTSFDYRMWHEEGEDDAVPCYDTRPYNFAPDMPTGWLVVRLYDQSSYVITDTDASSTCMSLAPDHGVEVVAWENTETSTSQYVCRWTRFTDLDTTTTDGWYSGGLWEQAARNGAPRDAYLRIETPDAEPADSPPEASPEAIPEADAETAPEPAPEAQSAPAPPVAFATSPPAAEVGSDDSDCITHWHQHLHRHVTPHRHVTVTMHRHVTRHRHETVTIHEHVSLHRHKNGKLHRHVTLHRHVRRWIHEHVSLHRHERVTIHQHVSMHRHFDAHVHCLPPAQISRRKCAKFHATLGPLKDFKLPRMTVYICRRETRELRRIVNNHRYRDATDLAAHACEFLTKFIKHPIAVVLGAACQPLIVGYAWELKRNVNLAVAERECFTMTSQWKPDGKSVIHFGHSGNDDWCLD